MSARDRITESQSPNAKSSSQEWNTGPGERSLKGHKVVPENRVEILPKGTHLPPDRTFLPQHAETDTSPTSYRGSGLDHEEIQDMIMGPTSKDVHTGMGVPGDQSKQEERARRDGGAKRSHAGLAQYGDREIWWDDRNKLYDPAKDYVGNSREEREYRNVGEHKGPTSGNRGPSNRTIFERLS